MKVYLIWSAEHNAWWRPGHNGYTTSIEEAGVYEKHAAEKIIDNANIPLPKGNGFRYVHEVMIPVSMAKPPQGQLTTAEVHALLEAGQAFLKTWPNEEFIPSLESGVRKLLTKF